MHPILQLDAAIQGFFSRRAPVASGDGLIVAFSGGPDSTALLLGLVRFARHQRLRVTAAHLDHGADAGSAPRARAAVRLAESIGVPCAAERREVPRQRCHGESPEAAARRIRYGFLEEMRARYHARWVATAHHRDDQAETVLLRWLFASGLEGLAGIRPRWKTLVRPLLELPRRELAAAVAAGGLVPVDDPTNRDCSSPRNLLRHRLLPLLAAEDPQVAARLARLATLAELARRRLRQRVRDRLRPQRAADGLVFRRTGLTHLPAELRPIALALLHRQAGAPYPAGRGARQELLRQLLDGRSVGCDCGDGWRWEDRGDLLALLRAAPAPPPAPVFAYTFEAPGGVVIREIGKRIRLVRGPVAPWMFQGSPTRTGLALPLEPGERVEIRNRRPGDRLWPLGASGSRRLKEVLIDARVPRHRRDSLPLLVVTGRIAWVPGVTIDERFRLAEHRQAWVAEVTEA